MKLPKILKIFLIIFLFFFLFSNSSRAVEEPGAGFGGGSSLEKFQQNLKNCADTGETSMECWIGGPEQVSEKPEAATGVMPAIANSLTTMILGPLPTLEEQTPEEQPYRPGGAIGGITNLIAAMYANPPASSVEYFADLGRNLGIVKPAYAQAGIGFQGLRPILPLWKAFRNLAYLFFTIVFIVIGFAIMFRVKLDPQTVISIQNAIPRVVVALILVTFSYAIAGLLIDLMYVILSIPVFALAQSGAIDFSQAQTLLSRYSEADFLTTMRLVTGLGVRGVRELIPRLLLPGAGIGGIVGAIFWAIASFLTGWGPLLAASVPVLLGLAFSFLGFLFRILFMLIKAYALSIILVILGPIIIMTEALPGRKGIVTWLRSLLSNLSVFFVTAFLFILLDIINALWEAREPIWGPPLVGGGGDIAKATITFGILMITPNVAQLVQALIEGAGVPTPEVRGETLTRSLTQLSQSISDLVTKKLIQTPTPKTT